MPRKDTPTPDQGASGHNLAILNRLAEFRDLRDGWDGPRSVAPCAHQITSLATFVAEATLLGLAIDRARAIADGDVCLHAFGGEPNERGTRPRRASICAGDSAGRVSAVLWTDDATHYIEADPDEIAAAVRDHLRQGEP